MSNASKRGPLIVEPHSQLRFPGPPVRPSRAVLKLINNTTKRIAFKIKTTAPSFYGVRPNSGIVFPRNTVEIEIARQPFTQDQISKIGHKFMVQSIVVPDDVEQVTKLWQTVDPSQLSIVKLRCIFEDGPMQSHQGSPMKLSPQGSEARKPQQIDSGFQSPQRQVSPFKISPKGSEAKGPSPKRKLSQIKISPRVSEEKKMQDAATDVKSTPSLESIRRVVEGTTKKPTTDADTEKKLEDSIALNGKPDNMSTRASVASQPPPKYQMSYHSNNSTSLASENPFSSQLTPIRLPSPERSQNKLYKPQTSKGQQSPTKQQKRRSSEIFTALQIATMNTEIHQLRNENKYLRNENISLKQEYQHRNLKQSTIRGEYVIPHTELPQSESPMPVCYIVASMTFALLCLIIGKFLL